ncbi:MAG: alpha/beta hydrolase [Mesorhizobium sp.]
MKAKDADILMIPGFSGSGPLHWQTRWQEKLSSARRVLQKDWDAPLRDEWAQAVADAVNASEKPVVLVAHSLGVPTVVNAIGLMTNRPVGAFLVAPPDLDNPELLTPQMLAFGPYPRDPLPFPSMMVGSQTDPYCAAAVAEDLAGAWGSLFLDAGEAGHINSEAGYGPWPEGSMAFAQFLTKLQA